MSEALLFVSLGYPECACGAAMLYRRSTQEDREAGKRVADCFRCQKAYRVTLPRLSADLVEYEAPKGL